MAYAAGPAIAKSAEAERMMTRLGTENLIVSDLSKASMWIEIVLCYGSSRGIPISNKRSGHLYTRFSLYPDLAGLWVR